MMFDRLFHRTSQAGEDKAAPLRFILHRIAVASDRPFWMGIALTTFFVVSGGLIASLAPLALKDLVDRFSNHNMGSVAVNFVAAPVGIYVGLLAAQRLCEQAHTYFYARAEQHLVRNFSAGAYAHILTLPLTVHIEKRSGALAQSLSQGVLGLRLVAAHLALSIAPVVVQLIVAGVVLIGIFDSKASILLLICLLAYCSAFAVGVVRLSGPIERVSKTQVDAGGLASDGLMNVEAIKSYTAERRFAYRYDMLLGTTEKSWHLLARRRLENGIVVSAVFAFSFGAILFFAGNQVVTGRISIGAFVLISTYVLQLVRPIEMLGFAIRDIGEGIAYLREIAGILAMAPEHSAMNAAAIGDAQHPAELRFAHVSFGFGDRKTIDDVTFDLPRGATFGIVGPSGAGKSSLLRLILRLYDPWRGDISLDGVPLRSIPLEQLRRQIALVSQDTILFHDTIASNIRFAVDQAEDQDVEDAAARAHLSVLLADLPDGLETVVGERGLKLSGGEKQRVSIARAALKQARLVIFDEATAALDPATERAVWTAMRGLAQDATTLVVTHRLSTVREADQILVLDHGKIVERGQHAELIARDGLYARLWKAQEGVERGAA